MTHPITIDNSARNQWTRSYWDIDIDLKYKRILLLLLLNACGRVADVMIFTFVSLMPVHNVCRICKIIKE